MKVLNTDAQFTALNYVDPLTRAATWDKFVSAHRTLTSNIASLTVGLTDVLLNKARAVWPVKRAEFYGAKLVIDGAPLAMLVQVKAIAEWRKNMARSKKTPNKAFPNRREYPSTRGDTKRKNQAFANTEHCATLSIEKRLRAEGVRWQQVAQIVAREFNGKWAVGLPIILHRYGVAA